MNGAHRWSITLCIPLLLAGCGRAGDGARVEAEVGAPALSAGEQWELELRDNLANAALDRYTEKAEVYAGSPEAPAPHVEAGLYRDGKGPTHVAYASLEQMPRKEDFPLAPGKVWKVNAKVHPPDTRVSPGDLQWIRLEGECRIPGWEEVAVSAGKFKALRIDCNLGWKARGARLRGSEQITSWYAPAVKHTVRSDHKVQVDGDERPFRDETLQLLGLGPKGSGSTAELARRLTVKLPGDPRLTVWVRYLLFGVLGSLLATLLAHCFNVRGESDPPRLGFGQWVRSLVSSVIATTVISACVGFVSTNLLLGGSMNVERMVAATAGGSLEAVGLLYLVILLPFWYGWSLKRRGVASFVDALTAAGMSQTLALAIYGGLLLVFPA